MSSKSADNQGANKTDKKRRNSHKQIRRLESVCRSAAALTGLHITLLSRRGHIIFKTGPAYTDAAVKGIRLLRLWFFRQLRKQNGSNRPAAPGPVIFSTEQDRYWAALSMKSTVWSRDLLLIGPALPDQAEGILQHLCDVISHSFHNTSAVITIWSNRNDMPALPAAVRTLRNSSRPDFPAEDIQYQYLLVLKTGDLQKIENAAAAFADKWNKLSSRPLRQQKNEALLIAQQATTAASETGLPPEISEGILDDHLRRIETCRTSAEVLNWIQNIFQELTERVFRQLQDALTQPVRLCQHYIARRLYSRITLDDLASYTGHNPSYLSRHFKSETGESLTKYITRKKIEAACELLRDYKKPIQDVSIMLAFSDQAHFTRAFRQITGTTPLKYLKSNQTETE